MYNGISRSGGIFPSGGKSASPGSLSNEDSSFSPELSELYQNTPLFRRSVSHLILDCFNQELNEDVSRLNDLSKNHFSECFHVAYAMNKDTLFHLLQRSPLLKDKTGFYNTLDYDAFWAVLSCCLLNLIRDEQSQICPRQFILTMIRDYRALDFNSLGDYIVKCLSMETRRKIMWITPRELEILTSKLYNILNSSICEILVKAELVRFG